MFFYNTSDGKFSTPQRDITCKFAFLKIWLQREIM